MISNLVVSAAELKAAAHIARNLMRRRSDKKLRFNPHGESHIEESKRIVLMGLSASNKFGHLYTDQGLEASFKAYESHQRYARLLEKYPDPLMQQGLRKVKEPGKFYLYDLKTLEEYNVIEDNISLKPDAETLRSILARRDAIIGFMYEWCIEAAGNRPKNFQECYKSEGATLSAEAVQELMQHYALRLSLYADYSHLITYNVIDHLLLNSRTKLPFNINIPF